MRLIRSLVNKLLRVIRPDPDSGGACVDTGRWIHGYVYRELNTQRVHEAHVECEAYGRLELDVLAIRIHSVL